MARTTDANMTSMLSRTGAESQTRARCAYLALTDGTIIGLTDHDRDLTVDIADISDVPVTMQSNGVKFSDISLATGFESDSAEMSGPLTAELSAARILGGRFNRALVRIFDVDWTQENPVPMYLLGGRIGQPRVEEGQFFLEVRSYMDFFRQTVGTQLTPFCRTSFGSDLCGLSKFWIETVVTTVSGQLITGVDLAGVYTDDYFRFGQLQFLSGDMAGTNPMEIVGYTGATGLVETLGPLSGTPEVGDTVQISQGCSLLKLSSDSSIPTCKTYDNVVNFRGFDQVPTSDQYLKVPVPGG